MRLACCPVAAAPQALLVVPPSALQSALASASQQLGRPTGELLQLLLSDPGALLALGYMGGSQGAAASWAQRLGLDPQVRLLLRVQECCFYLFCTF